ncbi:MAG: hypothetical protein O6951_07410 [Actinobacteria bacterium]|nr:hypothetical protein [Actinomycetota bacterium]
MTALLVTAFIAGSVATVNPCGFAMLPAYLSFFIGSERSATAPLSRAFRIAGVMTLSFLIVFGAAGLLLTVGIQTVIGALPWLALVVGVGITGLGVFVLRGGVLTLTLPGKGRVNRRSVFVFGSSYAVASLSCTLPIFLSLVVGSIATASLGEAVLLFLAYGLGMALVISAITVGLALGQDRMVLWIRGASRWIPVVSGSILIASGVFVVWYWATVLSSGSLTLGEVGIVRLIDQLSASIAGLARGNVGWFVVGLVSFIGLGGVVLARSRSDAPEVEPTEKSKLEV